MIVDPDFLDHWRTRMLVDLLGTEMAPLYIIRLWAHCHQRKGDTFTMPSDGVKAICRAEGDSGDLEEALIKGGWIERDGMRVIVTKWADHNRSLIQAWENGKRGGRPRKTQEKPSGNPADNRTETQAKPDSGSGLSQAKPIREEGIRGKDVEPNGSTVAPNRGSEKPAKQKGYTPEFESWWKSYPTRGKGKPRGDKAAAFREWGRLDSSEHPRIIDATNRLVQAGDMPKDAERFLRPPRGGGTPPYESWTEDTDGTPYRGSEGPTRAQRNQSANCEYTGSRDFLEGSQ